MKSDKLSFRRALEILECSTHFLNMLIKNNEIEIVERSQPKQVRLNSVIKYLEKKEAFNVGIIRFRQDSSSGNRLDEYGYILSSVGGNDIPYNIKNCVNCSPTHGEEVAYCMSKDSRYAKCVFDKEYVRKVIESK